MKNGVLLINMPFSGVDRPQIGIGLLQTALKSRGVACDTRYFNLVLADWIGVEFYQWFSQEVDHTIFAGEWVFAHHFFGDALVDGQGYLRHLREKLNVDEQTIDSTLRVRRYVGPFLDYCMRSVDWDRYSVVGFTSTFEQNLASLALAHAIKRRFPDKIIVMGGANCEYPMGHALHRCFPFLDYVFTGEADNSFPELVGRLMDGRPVGDVKGMVYRDGTKSVYTGPPEPVMDMDVLPYPDYDDFFEQVEGTSIRKVISQMVQVETSRGCWWGAKHHCTFCGLNALSMSFRAKTQKRALDEILHLAARYPVRQIAAVDNIMDVHYFRELLPELKRRKLKLNLFYEVKANMTKEQVKLLKEAGVTMIQPGIESLHRKMLTLMRKGVAPLQNIQLMKWCKQYGVRASWNLLYGFPGESAQDYEEMLPLLESLFHLPPPDGYGPIRLDRFSPYFMNPTSFGLVNPRPMKVYHYLYPFPEADLAEIAYFYQYDYGDLPNPKDYINPTLALVERWRSMKNPEASRLTCSSPSAGVLVVEDTRPNAVQPRTTLIGWQKEVYEFCDQARSLKTVERHLQEWLDGSPREVTAEELQAFLDRLVKLRIAARDQDQYLSLAVPVEPVPGPPVRHFGYAAAAREPAAVPA